VPIFLDAQMERPHTRTFKRSLNRWIPANRATAVWAALTIIKSWLDATTPPHDPEHLSRTFDAYEIDFAPMRGTRLLNSYEEWAETMGGILEWIGVEGFLANQDKMFAYADDEDGEVAAFLTAWADRFAEPVSVPDLVGAAWLVLDGLYGFLPSRLRELREDKRAHVLGQMLKKYQDRVLGSHKLVRHDGRPVTWQVIRVA
jgi:hypothetical protein